MPKPTPYDPGKRLRPLLASYAQQAADRSISDHTHPIGEITGLDGDHGDVTVSNNGLDWTIDEDAVIYAKMQDVQGASRLLGRGAGGGVGDVEEIVLGAGLSMVGTTLNATATGGGGGPSIGGDFIIDDGDSTGSGEDFWFDDGGS